MPKTHLVGFNQATRKTIRMHEPGADNKIYFEETTDISPVLELNKITRNRVDERAPWKEGDLFARIPPAVYWNLPPHIRDDEKAFNAWLNHDDQLPFRTRHGRV